MNLGEQQMRSSRSWMLVLLTVAGFVAMGATSPDCGEIAGPEFVYMSQMDLHVTGPGGGNSDDVKSEIVDSIDNADKRILASLGDDVMTADIAQALVDAKDRGLEVLIIADNEDYSTSPFNTLENNGFTSNRAGNCEIPHCDITYGDGELQYLPNPNLTPVLNTCVRQEDAGRVLCTADRGSSPLCGGTSGNVGAMCRPDDFNTLSHRFLIVDTNTVWNISGDGTGSGMFAWRGEGEWLMESFRREFGQIRGGTFSTTLDEYNGPLKSITDPHVHFQNDQGVVELRYNPQERLMKHVVDKVYSARSSVTLVTPKLTNPFVIDALEYKANNGFEVRVVISEQVQPDRSLNSRLANLNTRTVSGGMSIPTLVAVDVREDQDFMDFAGSPKQWPRHMMVLSHPLIRARPFAVLPPENPDSEDASDRVRVYPADLFNDGNMWHMREFSGNAGEWGELDKFVKFANALWNSGSNYQP